MIKYIMLLHVQLIPEEGEPPLDIKNSDGEHHPKMKRPRT